MSSETRRIAMWSGPRNLSTAMMYAFGNRADTCVVDEPFYASYLVAHGQQHPMRDAVLASQSSDPVAVIDDLSGPVDRPVFYQKHMTQHMIGSVPRDWLEHVTNVFLIRHPARVVASFAEKLENPTLADIGFVQQVEIFDQVLALGQIPVVIDSVDIRADPERMLRLLCAAINIPWDPAMLRWPAGGHASDGVWAAHWYGAVHRSTGFAGPEGALPELSGKSAALCRAALPFYERLKAGRLTF